MANAVGANNLKLSVRASDERYPISVYLNNDEKPSFTVYFNPGDPFVMEYVNAVHKLAVPDSAEDRESFIGEYLSFTDAIAKNLDAIFGDGAARLIFRYNGADNNLILSILAKFNDGYANYKEKVKASEAKAQADALIEARKTTTQFKAGNYSDID